MASLDLALKVIRITGCGTCIDHTPQFVAVIQLVTHGFSFSVGGVVSSRVVNLIPHRGEYGLTRRKIADPFIKASRGSEDRGDGSSSNRRAKSHIRSSAGSGRVVSTVKSIVATVAGVGMAIRSEFLS